MWSKEGEYVPFTGIFTCNGAVENYLCDLERTMQMTLKDVLEAAKTTADNWDIDKKRHEWLEDYCAQIALLATQVLWTEETTRAFDELEGGSETAMKDYLHTIRNRIGHLIERVRTDLNHDLRVKIITIITIDVHERDVVDNFVLKKIQDQQLSSGNLSSSSTWSTRIQKMRRESASPKSAIGAPTTTTSTSATAAD